MLLKNGLIYDEESGEAKKGDLRIEGEKIKEIDSSLVKKKMKKSMM